MISAEPMLNVGILEGAATVSGSFEGEFRDPRGHLVRGAFRCTHAAQQWSLELESGTFPYDGAELTFAPGGDVCAFRIDDVTIGVNFHWERKEPQLFKGAFRLLHVGGKGITVINRVPLEEYLKSVISSEMSATAPAELLRAHAITSRSWLVAMLERSRQPASPTPVQTGSVHNSVVRWYTREDHADFDVCADDHCQRYQGTTKIISRAAEEAILSTRGQFLVYENEICDARFYKACGGKTEEFQSAWEPKDVPYLRSVSDSEQEAPPVRTEEEMERWISSPPDAYCNTTDAGILRKILPSFDQETVDFFRWTVVYTGKELSALIRRKSGIDFGRLRDLVPVHRGPSGRITALRIDGERQTLTVGKELEIRRWLSPSHLYSSAFLVRIVRDGEGFAREFTLQGAGWGHGVGLCQIGAAVMATRGKSAREIVLHYFRGASLRTLY
jgi:peptidoglycan hydrolase-like amidase